MKTRGNSPVNMLGLLREQLKETRQKGAALVVIIVSMTIIAILGAGMLYLFSSSSVSEVFINNRHKAFALMQSGRNYATLVIDKANNEGNIQTILDLDKKTFNTADGHQFYITTKIVKAGVTVVESTGIANPNSVMETKQKFAFTVKDKTLIEGAAAVGSVLMYSGSYIDGYDSGTAPYAFDASSVKAMVQTNATTAGSITMNGVKKNPCIIYGSTYCGAGAASGDSCLTLNNFAEIKGSRLVASKNYPTPTLSLPTGGTPITILQSAGQTTTVPAGKWRADSSSVVMNSAIMNVTGIATLIIDGSLTLYNESQINIQSGGMLILWIKTRLEVGGTSKINYEGAPPNVLIKGISMTELAFVKDSRTYCAIYAPGSSLSIDSTSEIFGSVYAGTISMSGGDLHLDMAFSESTNLGY